MADGVSGDLIGRLVGRYKIESRLGSGGMGEVYLARQVEIGSRVAIKVMARGSKTNSEGAKRMFAEARAVNLVQHDRIVNILDMTRVDGRPALIMEYLRGVSLDRLLAGGPLPHRTNAELAIDILDALAAVHGQGIFHRDLKPGNVFVSPEGRATILDFGLAKMADDLLGTVIQTQAGMVMGTVPYMAPEQSRGEPFTAVSDLFAVGLLVYEAATTRRAFRGKNIAELLKEHAAGPAPVLSINADVPASLVAVIDCALSLDPGARYSDAGAMRAALVDVASDLKPHNIRARVDRFRAKSAIFVGVEPAFSLAPTVKEQAHAQAPAIEPPPAAAPTPLGPPPIVSAGTRVTSRLLVAGAAVAVMSALIALGFAMSMRSELKEREAELAEAKRLLAVERALSKRSPTDATAGDQVPSLSEWDTTFDAGAAQGVDKSDPAALVARAESVAQENPQLALELALRAKELGGRGDRYEAALARAHCGLRQPSSARAAFMRLSEQAKRRFDRKCKDLLSIDPGY